MYRFLICNFFLARYHNPAPLVSRQAPAPSRMGVNKWELGRLCGFTPAVDGSHTGT